MGIKLFSDGPVAPSCEPKAPNPNPKHFEILEIEEINGWTIAVVRYEGCTTYGGKKLLVYDQPADEIVKQQELDPHFIDNNSFMLYPFARFTPTDRGLSFARLVCENSD